MIATNKKQITISALLSNDEIVFYSCKYHSSCIKMRTIDGKRTFIIDNVKAAMPEINSVAGFTSTRHPSLTAAKATIESCYHW